MPVENDDVMEKVFELTIAKDFAAVLMAREKTMSLALMSADQRASLVKDAFEMAAVFVAQAKERGKLVNVQDIIVAAMQLESR